MLIGGKFAKVAFTFALFSRAATLAERADDRRNGI
jgi:hypothetical protein